MENEIDIKPMTRVNLPNIFTTGGDESVISDTVFEALSRSIAIGILTKYSRTSQAEFKFIIDSLKLTKDLRMLGETGEHLDSKSMSKTTYEDVYAGRTKMSHIADNLFRNILIISIMKADPTSLLIAKSVVTVAHLVPVKPEELPVVSPSMYTITVDLKGSLLATDMETVYRKHLPKKDD